MLSLLALLTYCLFIAMFAGGALDLTVPVQCYISPQPNPTGNQGALGLSVTLIISTTMTLCLLLSGYVIRIRSLYDRSCTIETLVSFAGHLAWSSTRRFNPKSQMQPNFVEVTAEVQSTIRLKDLTKIIEISSKSKWKSKVRSSSYQYDDSFISFMSGIAFSFSYGIIQVITYRWLYGRGLNGKASAIDFGQITPLFLLVLPILAAAEIYYCTTTMADRET